MDPIVAKWNDPERPDMDFVLTESGTIEDFQAAFTKSLVYATDFGLTATDEQKALADIVGPKILEEADNKFGPGTMKKLVTAAVLAALVVATGDQSMIDHIVNKHAAGRDDYGIPFDEIL